MTLTEFLPGEDFDADMDNRSYSGNQNISESSRNAQICRSCHKKVR